MNFKLFLCFVFSILFFFGCATNSTKQRQLTSEEINTMRRQNYVASNPEIPEEIKQQILNGFIQIGMDTEMVLAAWGRPYDILRSGDASGLRETWVYYSALPSPPEMDSSDLAGLTPADVTMAYAMAYSILGSKRKATYLFFENGIFVSFKEIK